MSTDIEIYEKLLKEIDERLADKRHMVSIRLAIGNKAALVKETLSTFPVNKKELQRRYRDLKEHTVENIDRYLAQAKSTLEANGCTVYLAEDAADAVTYVLGLVSEGATVVKSKSNVSREIDLSDVLVKGKKADLLETDFGDWVNQMLGTESVNPITPAIHLTQKAVEERIPEQLLKYNIQVKPDLLELVKVCRRMVREFGMKAEVGISGANAIAALEGAVVLVENEGNQRIVTNLPAKHIVIAGIDKVVPNLDDAMHVARCASIFGGGKVFGNYNSIIKGPSYTQDVECIYFRGMHGPAEVYVVLIDNGRKRSVGEGYRELLYCVNCGACCTTCPVYEQIGERFGYKYELGKGLMQAAFHANLRAAVEHGLFECTTCGMCVEACPGRIDVPTMMENLRAKAVEENLNMPPHEKFVERIYKYGNPYGRPQTERVHWAKDLKMPRKGEVLFWAGCTYSTHAPEVAKKSVEVLRKIGVQCANLGVDESCCGSVAKRTGFAEDFEKMAKNVMETVGGTGATKIVTSCPGCYRTFRKDYPTVIGETAIETVHTVQLIAEVVKSGKLQFKREIPQTVTYHDPCHLGRHLGIYDEPRMVIESVPGIKLVEMDRIREEARCCGAGAGVRGAFRDLSLAMGVARIRDAENVGAELLLSACPFCLENLREAAEKSGSRVKVLDVIELLDQAL